MELSKAVGDTGAQFDSNAGSCIFVQEVEALTSNGLKFPERHDADDPRYIPAPVPRSSPMSENQKNIIRLRELLGGISQRRLGEMVGVSRDAVALWEASAQEPSAFYWSELSKLVNRQIINTPLPNVEELKQLALAFDIAAVKKNRLDILVLQGLAELSLALVCATAEEVSQLATLGLNLAGAFEKPEPQALVEADRCFEAIRAIRNQVNLRHVQEAKKENPELVAETESINYAFTKAMYDSKKDVKKDAKDEERRRKRDEFIRHLLEARPAKKKGRKGSGEEVKR